MQNIKNQKNNTRITIYFNNKKYILKIIDSIEELNNNGDCLILFKNNQSLPVLNSNSSNVFAYKSSLFKWEGFGWKREEDYINSVDKIDSKSTGEVRQTTEKIDLKSNSDSENEDSLKELLPSCLNKDLIQFIENEENNPNPILPTIDNINDDKEDNNKSFVNIKYDEDLTAYGISNDSSSIDIAKIVLKKNISIEHYSIFKELINKLISEYRVRTEDDIVENSLSQAIILAKSLSFYNPRYMEDYRRLLLAMDSNIQEHQYASIEISNLFESETSLSEDVPVLKLMTVLRGLFSLNPRDYNLINYSKGLFKNYEYHFNNLQILKPLYRLFLNINDICKSGFTITILQNFANEKNKLELLENIQIEAKDNLHEPISQSNNLLRALSPLPSDCFGQGSDMQECMKIIISNNLNERNLVELIFDDYCDIEENNKIISNAKIESVIASKWEPIASKHDSTIPIKVVNQKIRDLYRTRLKIIERWLEVTSSTAETVANKLSGLRKEILVCIDSILSNVNIQIKSKFDIAIIRKMLKHFKDELNGNFHSSSEEFSDLLRTGLFCQGRNFVPLIDEYFAYSSHYEPWRNILKHIIEPVEGLRKVLDKISQSDYPFLFDNLGQSLLIQQYINETTDENEDIYKYFNDISEAKKAIRNDIGSFQGKLEMAFAYGRISENLKEDINDGIVNVFEKYSKFYNYGCIRAFLKSQEELIEESKEKTLLELKQSVVERQNKITSPSLSILLEKALEKLNAPENNFAVAEEYINRYDSGVSDTMDIVDSTSVNHFKAFIENDFEKLYDFCNKNKNKELTSFGIDYIERELKKKKVSTQYQDSSKNLLKSIPIRVSDSDSNNKILKLLTELGFDVKNSTRIPLSSGNNILYLTVEIIPEAKDKSEYLHPVDIMGTKIKSPIDVFCLFGNVQPTEVVDKICKMEKNRTVLVLLNGILSLADRRKMSEYFHKEKSNRNPFLLIDRVLLLYLALFPKNERLPIMLNCTLPFTSNYQPFVIKGSVSDEMFIGRKKELNQILDPNGPVIVYGGRQLGKTALLERALSLANHPNKKEYAILIRATDIFNEISFVQTIVKELKSLNLQIAYHFGLQKRYRIIGNVDR